MKFSVPMVAVIADKVAPARGRGLKSAALACLVTLPMSPPRGGVD